MVELADRTVVRVMDPGELPIMRKVSIGAFGGDEHIGVLIDALRASWAWSDELSFVAELDGEIVGQVLYTSAILDGPDRLVDVLVLSPIGVRVDLHGHGIGSRMINETMATIERSRPEQLVFLEGSPRYYPRFGFEPGGSVGFRKPSTRIPDPAFMVRRLPGHDPSIVGTVVYPDAFWRTDSVGLR